jgi:hypothetical protein
MIGINSTEENNLTRSETELLIPAEGYITAAVFLFFIGFFGFFLNLSILLFMWKKKQVQIVQLLNYLKTLLSYSSNFYHFSCGPL